LIVEAFGVHAFDEGAFPSKSAYTRGATVFVQNSDIRQCSGPQLSDRIGSPRTLAKSVPLI
jgi:hypothetical protein